MYCTFFLLRYQKEGDSLQAKYNEQEMRAIKLEEEVERYTQTHVHACRHSHTCTPITHAQKISWLTNLLLQ